jgi:hypothetical protein
LRSGFDGWPFAFLTDIALLLRALPAADKSFPIPATVLQAASIGSKAPSNNVTLREDFIATP